jgi:hypothetical protein
MPIKIQPFDEACAHAPWNLGSVAHTRVAPGRTLLPPLLLLLACLRAQLDLQVSGNAASRRCGWIRISFLLDPVNLKAVEPELNTKI